MKRTMLGLALLIPFLAGCASTDVTMGRKEIAPANVQDYAPSIEEYGKKAVCPITHRQFTVTKDTKALIYRGSKLYFSDTECYEKFLSEHQAR